MKNDWLNRYLKELWCWSISRLEKLNFSSRKSRPNPYCNQGCCKKKTTQKNPPGFFSKIPLKKNKPTKKNTCYFFFEKIRKNILRGKKENRQDTCTVNFNFFNQTK